MSFVKCLAYVNFVRHGREKEKWFAKTLLNYFLRGCHGVKVGCGCGKGWLLKG